MIGGLIGGCSTGAAMGAIGVALATSSIPFSNTIAIAEASITNSLGMQISTVGKTSFVVSIGFASYDFDNGKANGIWNKLNSIENFGYVLGALANLSDIITYADYITSVKRALNPISGLTEEELIRIYIEDTDTWLNNIILGRKANYAGNSPANISPTEFLNYKSLTPLDGVERIQKSGDIFGGYLHDLTYFEKVTDGIRGVLFNTNVLAADKALISGMTTLIRSGKYAGFVHEANLIRNVFRVTVGIKQSYSYSYLLNLSKP